MNRLAVLPLLLAVAAFAADEEETIVFRSDVSLGRVDAQVLDRSGRAVLGLQADDFVLLVDGQPQEVRDFGAENRSGCDGAYRWREKPNGQFDGKRNGDIAWGKALGGILKLRGGHQSRMCGLGKGDGEAICAGR